MKIILPFPPSVNRLYSGKARRYKSPAYKAWLASCPGLLTACINHPVSITGTLYWPDNRNRDVGNYGKAIVDYLVDSLVLLEDHWGIVQSETWKSGGIDKIHPRVEIEIKTIDESDQIK